MNRRQFLQAWVGGIGMAAGLGRGGWGADAPAAAGGAWHAGMSDDGGRVLYNGIRLPSP